MRKVNSRCHQTLVPVVVPPHRQTISQLPLTQKPSSSNSPDVDRTYASPPLCTLAPQNDALNAGHALTSLSLIQTQTFYHPLDPKKKFVRKLALFSCGAVSGVTATSVCYPCDVLWYNCPLARKLSVSLIQIALRWHPYCAPGLLWALATLCRSCLSILWPTQD